MRLTSLLLLALIGLAPRAWSQSIRQIDPSPAPEAGTVTAIAGATLIDGSGGPPLPDATVLIRGDRIALAGPSDDISVPEGADRVDGSGLTVLPGLIDAHFHGARPDRMPAVFLQNGVTSLRDPGAWIESYAGARSLSEPIPRLFLTGPHLDSPPPAYPRNSLLVRDEMEARVAVERLAASGASAVKAYFRLPLALIAATTRAADSLGLPVTGHLEIVDARDAIRAGLDGIEHVTSFGTALMAAQAAEAYRQAVIADNEARRDGRYRVWSDIDLASPAAREVIDLLVQHDVFLSPTLAYFERRAGDENVTENEVSGFGNMLRFTGLAKQAGAAVVVGSHTRVRHAKIGWAFHREMELLVEAGMTPMETIVAATSENARFLRIDDRLGTIEPGKLADLLLVRGDPVADIRAMREVWGVMLNGHWVRKTGRGPP